MRALLFASFVVAMLATCADAAVLRLEVNHSTRLHLVGQAASVIVGNPLVADATVVDSRTVFLSGRAMGSTDVVVMDALGRTLYQGDVSIGPSGSAVTVFRGGAVLRGVAESEALACAPTCRPQEPATAASLGAAAASPAASASTGMTQAATAMGVAPSPR